MEHALSRRSDMSDRTATAVAAGGFAAGLLDILFAFVNSGLRSVPPETVLQAVASGIFGKAAYSGGAVMALTGALLHFGMTMVMAAIFVFAYRRIATLRSHVMIAGLTYGAAIFFVMKFVVLPLSNFPGKGAGPFNPYNFAAHILLVGLPIALAARQWGTSGR